MARYIIIGAGAIGAVLAAQLEQAGIGQVLVGRGKNIETIRTRGVELIQRDVARTVKVQTATSPSEVTLLPDDVLVAATKVQDLPEVFASWAWQPVTFATHTGTASQLPLVTLQNGLAADRMALRYFAKVLGGTILTPSQHLTPGQVRVGTEDAIGVITLGLMPRGVDQQVAAVAADFRRAQYLVQESPDVGRWKAAKLLYSVRNGLEVLSGDPEQVQELGRRLVAEAQQVFSAAGIAVADPATERDQDLSRFRIDQHTGVHPGQQSTWQSFTRGSSSEVDYLNGEIVQLGRLHQVPTPYNAALQQELGMAAANHEAPGLRDVSAVFTRVQLLS